MVDKTKKSPLPDRTTQADGEPITKQAERKSAEPRFVRGTIDPPTKKER